jgi:hypothetical protein
MTDHPAIDDLVRHVAGLLPFPVELWGDMAGPSMLQIDLGRRGGPDDPPDTASIDPTMTPVLWMFDVEGGRETIASTLGLDAAPAAVAEWVTEMASRYGSPAFTP